MPYEFNWHDPEQTIIRVDMVGQLSWEEFSDITTRIVEELAKATHRIDLIYYDQAGMPKGNPLPHIKAAYRRMAEYNKYLGLVITVSSRNGSAVIKVMVDIMMRAYQLDRTNLGESVTTLDEALRQISESRAKDKVMTVRS